MTGGQRPDIDPRFDWHKHNKEHWIYHPVSNTGLLCESGISVTAAFPLKSSKTA